MPDIASSKQIPKPALRGLLHTQIKKNLYAVGVSCLLAGLYMKFIFGDGRKRAYIEFYRNYDAEKEFETMRKKGLFDSCDTD